MKMGLGTAQLGLNYGIANNTGRPHKLEAAAIMYAAADGGIDCFDTASSYGECEKIIGGFIKESEFRLKICTKFSDCSTVEQELQKSLRRLSVDKLDYFLLHKPEQVFLPEFGEKLELLKQNPAVGKVGVSVYNSAEIMECLNHGVQVIQIPFNIIDSRLISLMERVKTLGVELHARSIYLQGLLLSNAPIRPPGVGKYLKVLDALSKEQGVSVKALSFLYVRDCDYIDRFFIGCETVGQVMENLALYKLPKLSKELIDRIRFLFTDISEGILNPSLW